MQWSISIGLYDNSVVAVDDQSHLMESRSLSSYLTGYVHDLMGNIIRRRAMLESLRGRVLRCQANDVARKADVVKPFLKTFRRVPKHKPEGDPAVPPPKKRAMKNSSVSFDIPQECHLWVGSRRVPKRKPEGDPAVPPPKKRAMKNSSVSFDIPQECHLWRLPDELLFDIMNLLDTDSLRSLSQVSKLLQGFSGRRYLAAVGFKFPIAGWLDLNEAVCEALPVWRRVSFRTMHTLWFTSSQVLTRQQLGAMCAFFDSLEDTQAVHRVHMYLYVDPTSISPIFGSLLASIQRSGCSELHASTHSVSCGSIRIPRKVHLLPSGLASLTSLNVSSPIFFFPHTIRFTLSMLQTALLASLRLNNTGLNPVQWAALLRKVNLPHLAELEVDQSCPLRALTSFLITHQAVSKLSISHYGVPTLSMQWTIRRPALHSLRELVGSAASVLGFLKSVTLSGNFQSLRIKFPPYYPGENVFPSILSCAEYLPHLPSLEIAMPTITSLDKLATFVAFPMNDRRIVPARHLTLRGTHPVLSTPDVLDIIVACREGLGIARGYMITRQDNVFAEVIPYECDETISLNTIVNRSYPRPNCYGDIATISPEKKVTLSPLWTAMTTHLWNIISCQARRTPTIIHGMVNNQSARYTISRSFLIHQTDVTSLSLSKPSKEIENPVDGRVTVASTSSVAEESASTINIRETTAVTSGVVVDTHSSATMPVETVENPWSEASENTAVVMRSIRSSPGRRSAFMNTAHLSDTIS
ncbi:hypothetical protein EDD15DRAFT_2204777 [Pisolithus albus]|nr:hypothetical protein EDD15DRAFT_2204777 [Pisolithus albus]